jgi:4-alpha-glucanotransferase
MTPCGRDGDATLYHTTLTVPSEPGLVWYYFVVRAGGAVYYYGNNERQLGGAGAVYSDPPPSYQITVHLPGVTVPTWYKNAVVYQIFVDRFFNGNRGGRVKNAKPGSLIHPAGRMTPSTSASGRRETFSPSTSPAATSPACWPSCHISKIWA